MIDATYDFGPTAGGLISDVVSCSFLAVLFTIEMTLAFQIRLTIIIPKFLHTFASISLRNSGNMRVMKLINEFNRGAQILVLFLNGLTSLKRLPSLF